VYAVTALLYGFQDYPLPLIFSSERANWQLTRVGLLLYVIQGHGWNIMVDAGMSRCHAAASNPSIVAQLGSGTHFVVESDPLDLLKSQMGLAAGDIDFIVVTHFHLDHVANLALFPSAKIIVSRKGLAQLLAPSHDELVPRTAFPRDVLCYVVGDARERLMLAEDRDEVLPGIEVAWTGGHSVDHQAVRVKTPSGWCLFPGDNVPFYRNLESHDPPGQFVTLSESYAALKMAEAESGIVVPAHDPLVIERHAGGIIATPVNGVVKPIQPGRKGMGHQS
jgi:glyoxylase-like metal-dependent hydrolase (beta-lactamase superfamily II)